MRTIRDIRLVRRGILLKRNISTEHPQFKKYEQAILKHKKPKLEIVHKDSTWKFVMTERR